MTDKDDIAGIEVLSVGNDDDDVWIDECSRLKIMLSWEEVKIYCGIQMLGNNLEEVNQEWIDPQISSIITIVLKCW